MSKSFVEHSPDRVENANQMICSYIDNIKSTADLYVKLTENGWPFITQDVYLFLIEGRSNVSGLGNRFYAKGVEEFFLEKRVPIPPELYQEMDR